MNRRDIFKGLIGAVGLGITSSPSVSSILNGLGGIELLQGETLLGGETLIPLQRSADGRLGSLVVDKVFDVVSVGDDSVQMQMIEHDIFE